MRFLSFIERILTVLFLTLIMLAFDLPYIALLTLICAFTHELGHYAAIRLIFKRDANAPIGKFNGLRIGFHARSYKEELTVVLCGPLANFGIFLICFLLKLLFKGALREYISDFAFLNLMTGVSNMVLLEGYDGYNALSALISIFSKEPTKYLHALWWVSFITSVIFCFSVLYLMLKIGEGYWLFSVFFALMLSFIAKRQKNAI